ncbi:MAG: hypothetical protein R3F62_02920 [Planctomycetota bacterium]
MGQRPAPPRGPGARLLADLEPWLWGQELGAEDLGSLLALREHVAESSADPECDA